MDGADGMAGMAGSGGFDYYPAASWGCNSALDLVDANTLNIGTDGIEESGFSYSGIVFSNGDVDASCEGGLGSVESASASHYYTAPTLGAAAASCIYALDYPPFTDNIVGWWQYQIDDQGPFVVYNDDPSHPASGNGVTFEAGDCVIRKTNDDGEWEEVAFTELFGG